jgi:hypothetical protein
MKCSKEAAGKTKFFILRLKAWRAAFCAFMPEKSSSVCAPSLQSHRIDLDSPLASTPLITATLGTEKIEKSFASEILSPNRPLDFLLPFTVVANVTGGNLTTTALAEFLQPLQTAKFYTPDEIDLLNFFICQNRFPFAADKPAAWEYQGWLLPYVILAHALDKLPNRWGWWAKCQLDGKLIDEAIPQVHFVSELDSKSRETHKNIEKCLDIITHSGTSGWNAFSDFVEWLAWGLGVGGAKPTFNEKTNRGLYQTFNLEPFLLAPADHLGQFLAEQKAKGYNPNAFFPTPHAVCELMAQINFGEANRTPSKKDSRAMTVCDPAVGTGRMLLHASNFSVRLYGTDIDPVVVKICLINGALYAPFLAFPFPEKWFDETTPERNESPEKVDICEFAAPSDFDEMANLLWQQLADIESVN